MGDYDALVALFDELDEFHRLARPDVFRRFDGPARTREQIEQWLAGPGSTVLVAESGQDVIGLAVLLTRPPATFAGAVPHKVIELDISWCAPTGAASASAGNSGSHRGVDARAGSQPCRGRRARLQSRRPALLREFWFLALDRPAGVGGVR